MSQVSRPMQIALAATLLLLAVWFVALRPKPTTAEEAAAPAPAPAQTTPAPSSGAAPGTEGLTGAIDKAREAVTTANGDAERAEQGSADAPAASADDAKSARADGGGGTVSTKPIHTHGPVASVRAALKLHKAIAIAFVDSATADSQAVERELLHVSHFDGRAFTIAVPLADLSDYGFVTNSVEVTVAPTVVIVDPLHRATAIVGAADRGEIEQRLADALAVKRR